MNLRLLRPENSNPISSNCRRTGEELVPDGSVPGLSIRLFPGGAANWSFLVRVAGEGGVNDHGKRLLGKKLRISLGNYPEVSLQAARARANHMADQAKHGLNPKDLLKESVTAGSLSVADLSKDEYNRDLWRLNDSNER